MTLTLSRPLVVFDIESTGRDPATDRIVEIALVVLSGDEQRVYEWRVNPEMPIPAEVTAIHGISDADVKDAPKFKDIAPMIAALVTGADLSGFNARTYDVPMLECEFARVGMEPSPLEGALIVDTKEIFHSKEPRDLTAAMRFYCDESLEGAHGAKADALAAAKVLFRQLERYPDLPQTVEGLAEQFKPKESFVDPTRKLRFDAQGEPMINFGQHRGVTLLELAKNKRDYLDWILGGEWHPKVKDAVRKAIERARQEKEKTVA